MKEVVVPKNGFDLKRFVDSITRFFGSTLTIQKVRADGREQWTRLLAHVDELRTFIEENRSKLKLKPRAGE